MSAGTLRSAVSKHPRFLGVALAVTIQLAAISPVAAGCSSWIFGP